MIHDETMNLSRRLHTYFYTLDPLRFIDIRPLTSTTMSHILPPTPNGDIQTPIMACTPATFQPAHAVPRLSFVILDQHSSLTAIQEGLDTNARGFDPAAASTTETEATTFRASLQTNWAFTALLDTQPVAAGMVTPPLHGVAELVGITTLTAYRRRGIAAALTSEIVRVAFAHGVDIAMLRTDNPTAYRVYQRLGFAPVAILIMQREQATG